MQRKWNVDETSSLHMTMGQRWWWRTTKSGMIIR